MKLRAVDAMIGAALVWAALDIIIARAEGAGGWLGAALVMSLAVTLASCLALFVGALVYVQGSADKMFERRPVMAPLLCALFLSIALGHLSWRLFAAPGLSLAVALGATGFCAARGYIWGARAESPTAAVVGALVSGLLFYRTVKSVDLIQRVNPGALELPIALVLLGTGMSFILAAAVARLLLADDARELPGWFAVLAALSGIALAAFAVAFLAGPYVVVRQTVYWASFLWIALGISRIKLGRSVLHRLPAVAAALVGMGWLIFGMSPLDSAYNFMRNAPASLEILRETGLARRATMRQLDEFEATFKGPWKAADPAPKTLPWGLKTPEELSVLLVSVDTLRYDFTGYSGQASPGLTPHLDWLAERSQRFHRAYAQGGWTSLSIPSIHWSKYPRNIDFVPLMEDISFQLYLPGTVPESVTIRKVFQSPIEEPGQSLAEILSAQGFQTWAVPNDGFTHYFSPDLGFTRGFEHVLYPRAQYEQRAQKPLELVGASDGFSAQLADEALQVLGDERFFMWVHFFNPHVPYQDHEGSAFRGYESEVHYMDRQFGRILERLREQGRLEKTLIAVVADHGEEFGRGHGLNLSEASMRVPLLIYLPGVEGQDINDAVGVIDLAPTLLELLKIEAPPTMDGYSLLGAIHDPAAWSTRPVFMETWRYRGATQHRDLHMIGVVKDGAKVVFDQRLSLLEYYDVSEPGAEKVVTELKRDSPDWARFERAAGALVEWADEL